MFEQTKNRFFSAYSPLLSSLFIFLPHFRYTASESQILNLEFALAQISPVLVCGLLIALISMPFDASTPLDAAFWCFYLKLPFDALYWKLCLWCVFLKLSLWCSATHWDLCLPPNSFFFDFYQDLLQRLDSWYSSGRCPKQGFKHFLKVASRESFALLLQTERKVLLENKRKFLFASY